MAITFRANKNQALTYSEMDTNFGSYFYSSSIHNGGQTLKLHYTSSVPANVNLPTHEIPLTTGIGTNGSDQRVAFFTGSSALTTTPGFIVSSSHVGINLDEANNQPLTYHLEVSGSIKASNSIIQTSDERLKDNITPIAFGLDKVEQLSGVTYTFKGKDKVEAGLIAQEIQNVIPEVVFEDNNGYLGVNYNGVIPYLIEAIKDLKDEIKDLKSKL